MPIIIIATCMRVRVCGWLVVRSVEGGCGRHEPPHKYSGGCLAGAATYDNGAPERRTEAESMGCGADVGGDASHGWSRRTEQRRGVERRAR